MYVYIYIGNMYTGSAKRGISQLIFIYNIYIYACIYRDVYQCQYYVYACICLYV